jgi:hypothetical protein
MCSRSCVNSTIFEILTHWLYWIVFEPRVGGGRGRRARVNLRGQKSLGPLKMSLEMVHKVIVPQKKIMSRSFLIVIYALMR